jgi:predicted HTH transcriptional regulator
MNAADLLEQLNTLDEHERVEAKRASEVGKSLLETVCSFANEPGLDGGWILLGVVREEMALFPAYEVEGIEQPDKISADLASQCRSVFNVPVHVDITTEQLEGKAIIVVRVPEAPAQNKPVYFQSRGLPRGALRRVGSTDQHCTEDDLSLLYQGRQTDSFDVSAVADTSLDDVLPEAVADYRQARAEANPDAEELRWSDEDLLQSLGCIKRVNSHWQLTVAGLLLFGKPQTLRRCLPMTRVDYIRVPGREWIPDPETRFDTVEMRDPLFPDDDAKALVFVKEAGVIDNAAYRELTGLDALAASQSLRRLRDAGLLTQQGRSSATYYIPTAKLMPPAATPALASNLSGQSSNPPSLSSNLSEQSSNSQSVAGRRSAGDTRARESLLAQVPGNLAVRIGALGQRNPPDEVREIVLALCSQRSWRAEELGVLLQRNTEYVRNNYLRPLLRSGRLQMTNPQDVNDPQQAYRAAEVRSGD